MPLTRRECMAAAAVLPAAARAVQAAPLPKTDTVSRPFLPAKHEFPAMAVTYLDSGTMHPISIGAKQVREGYLESRNHAPGAAPFSLDGTDERVRGKFARLIGAQPEEICIVQSTTAGEHLVVKALDIPASGGRILTDVLHFPGSFYLYDALARQGMDVVWLKPKDGQRIAIEDVEAAVDRKTRLVALSLVSTINGFQHDLKKVCDIAHAKGAYVYADIIHAAGSVPVNVKESAVDFAASATYKWLMGDFGLGFLYARADLLDRLRRSQFGYEQIESMVSHVYPFDPPGSTVADFGIRKDATGHFATGTTSSTCAYHLDYSLSYIAGLGVEAIQAHRAPLLRKARQELVRLGYQPMTPVESTAGILTFAYKDAQRLGPRLEKAKVKITLGRNRFRITPSVFNDVHDIERLVEALS